MAARRAATPDLEPFRLSRLVSAFELDAIDLTLLLLTALPEIDARYPNLDLSRRIHELTRRVITRFV